MALRWLNPCCHNTVNERALMVTHYTCRVRAANPHNTGACAARPQPQPATPRMRGRTSGPRPAGDAQGARSAKHGALHLRPQQQRAAHAQVRDTRPVQRPRAAAAGTAVARTFCCTFLCLCCCQAQPAGTCSCPQARAHASCLHEGAGGRRRGGAEGLLRMLLWAPACVQDDVCALLCARPARGAACGAQPCVPQRAGCGPPNPFIQDVLHM